MENQGTQKTINQRTFARPVSCRGTGIHSGCAVTVTFKPAPVNTGIIFVRTDLADASFDAAIPALSLYRAPTGNYTQVGLPDTHDRKGPYVATIEHIMAALAAFDIDNAIIDIDGPEAPIMDGSSSPFLALFQCVGSVSQEAPRFYLEVVKPVSVCEASPQGLKSVTLEPIQLSNQCLTITYRSLDTNADPLLNNQSFTYHHSPTAFDQQISKARTVGFYDDIERLQSLGLGLGGSLDNTVVMKNGRVLNPEGLRYADEFARHKVLDALGDLMLAGHPIIGTVTSIGGGHALNAKALDALLSQPDAFRLVTLGGAKLEGSKEASPIASEIQVHDQAHAPLDAGLLYGAQATPMASPSHDRRRAHTATAGIIPLPYVVYRQPASARA